MMRAWENRADTVVCDEPLYAHYLKETGLPHPGAAEVMAAQETDWRKVTAGLTGEIPSGKRYYYQKHMAHHLLPVIDREWITKLTNVILIRDPNAVLSSLVKVLPEATVFDTGFPQLLELFTWLADSSGADPVVVDAGDVLADPKRHLQALCRTLDIPFDVSMLSWPPGPRPSDGVWARYWYGSVNASTGFTPYQPKTDPLPPELEPVLETCLTCYDKLYASRLRSE